MYGFFYKVNLFLREQNKEKTMICILISDTWELLFGKQLRTMVINVN